MLPISPEALPPLALRLRLANTEYPVVGQLRLAANHRLREANELMRVFRWHGAAYLAGYAAEIGLGYCWARFTGANPSASAEVLLPLARKRAKNLIADGLLDLCLPEDYRQGHSPLFWWRLYACERLLYGKRVDRNTEQRMESLVDFLQAAWEVWLRYMPEQTGLADAKEMVYRATLLLEETYRMEN